MSKPLQVVVGQKYVLRLPESLPDHHQLLGLRDELEGWLRARRPGSYDPVAHTWVEDPGTEPVSLFGEAVVTVRAITTIEPVIDPEVLIDGMGNIRLADDGQPLLASPRWQPLEEPVPAAILHLSRSPEHVMVRVPLTPDQILGLDMGLDPELHYIVAGHLLLITASSVIGTPNVDEWADVEVPTAWLHDLDEIPAWDERELEEDLSRFDQEENQDG